MRKMFKVALAAALGSCAIVAPAQAQRYDRVVAFGDSYADIGNVQALLTNAGLGAFFDSTTYPTGRFSGGTNFVDTIASAYGISQDNYAIGGAQAGTGNVAASGLLPGFQQQWTAFTQGGATYTDLAIQVPVYVSGVATTIPAGGLQFKPDDLAVFSVGGNDARGYRISGGTVAGADAAAAVTAQEATTGLDALVARGIRHLVWTAGDVGQLAEAIGQPSAAAGTAFSVAYNTRMQAVLAPIAASGVQVAYVDITTIGNIVRADPARFGFTNTTDACPLACIGNPGLQKQYLFYVDGVHLTSAGFALVGEYAVNQLDAPYSFRANGDVVANAAQDFGQTITGRLDLARDGKRPDGLSFYFQGTGDHRHYDYDDTSDGYRYRSYGATGGAEWKQGGLTAGGIFSWTKSHADSGVNADDQAKAKSYQVGAYAVYDTGSLFAQGYGGFGWHHLDIRRTGVADPLTASPHATSIVAGGRAGWLVPTGLGRIGPVAGIAYAYTKLDGYAETGDAAAGLVVGHQRFETAVGSAGLEWRPEISPAITPWLRATAEKSLQGDGRNVFYAPEIAPTIINRFEIGSASKKVYGDVAGGISARLGQRISIEGTVHTTFSRNEGNDYGGFAGVRVSL